MKRITALAGLALAGCGGSHPAPSGPVAGGVPGVGSATVATANGNPASFGSGNPDGPMTGSPASPAPANPVPILRETGVPVPATVSIGQVDAYGDRYVSGQFVGLPGSADDGVATDRADGESVDVYTYADQAAFAAGVALDKRNMQDGEAVIAGHLFTVEVYSVTDLTTNAPLPWGSPQLYGPTPTVIAARVHGRIIAP